MLKPKDDFWQRHYRRQADYERGSFLARVTAVYSDAVYEVQSASGLSGSPTYEVNNGTGYNFVVGDMVIVARVGGQRGNRHVIIARAGYSAGSGSLPYVPSPAPGGEYDPSESLSEVVDARSSEVYGAKASLDARLEAGDAEVQAARHGAADLSAHLDTLAPLSSPQFTGAPRAEKYEVQDGAKYITYDGGGNITLTDAVTGTKTLSELAAGSGVTDHGALTGLLDDDHPQYATDDDLSTHAGLPNVHHPQAHALDGADHTITGKTAREVLTALTATTFAFKPPHAATGTLAARPASPDADGDLYYATDIDTLYIGDGGAWVSYALSDAKPLAPILPAAPGTAATASRADHQHPDFAAICERMLDLVLRNQLDPGVAKAYVTYVFGNASTDNNGIATWSGAGWSSLAGYRATSTAANYYEQYFIGEKVWLTRGTYTGSGTHTVTLDTVAQADWNQDIDGAYILDGLSYGVHVIRVTYGGAGELRIGGASFWQWPYAAKGGSGDAVAVEYVPPYVCATTIGTSTTNNLAVYPNVTAYGEAITPRLPCTTAQANDIVVLRDPIGIIGGTTLKPGLVRLPLVEPYYRSWFRPGQTITLGSGGAVRGCRPTASVAQEIAPNLSASIIKVSFTPFIGRITAVGNPTNFTVGEIVFGITVYCTGGANGYVQSAILASTYCAVDFYNIPAALL
jgi:hypothetical protein